MKQLFMMLAVVLGLSSPALAEHGRNSPGQIIGDVLTGGHRHFNRGHRYGRRYIVRRRVVQPRVVHPYAESYQPRVVHPYDYSHDRYNHHHDHDGDDE